MDYILKSSLIGLVAAIILALVLNQFIDKTYISVAIGIGIGFVVRGQMIRYYKDKGNSNL